MGGYISRVTGSHCLHINVSRASVVFLVTPFTIGPADQYHRNPIGPSATLLLGNASTVDLAHHCRAGIFQVQTNHRAARVRLAVTEKIIYGMVWALADSLNTNLVVVCRAFLRCLKTNSLSRLGIIT